MDACSDVCEGEAGTLLADLERRQDDVLAQLDALDRQLTGLLVGLGVTLVDDAETANSKQAIDSGDEGDFGDEVDSVVDSVEEVGAEPIGDQPKRHEIKASTWDEPRWESSGGVTAAVRFAPCSNAPQDADESAAATIGFAKLPHQETPAAMGKPRGAAANAVAVRKRAA